MSNTIERGAIANFHDNAMQELGRLVINEQDAKEVMLVAMVQGVNGVLSGEPGGSKSTLMFGAQRLVGDIQEGDIAHVPPTADMTPRELIGGMVESSKATTSASQQTSVEVNATRISGIVKPESKVLLGDEISRLNPHAANALLGALEERRIITSEGALALDGLVYAFFTMNPSEHQQGTFKITHAMASRMWVGAELGSTPDSEDRIIDGILGGFRANAASMRPVTTSEELRLMRSRAQDTAFPVSLHGETKELLKSMRSSLAGAGIKEAPGRMTLQVSEVAKTLAALDGEEAVQRENIKKAVRLVAGARFAALGTGGRESAHDTIQSIFN